MALRFLKTRPISNCYSHFFALIKFTSRVLSKTGYQLRLREIFTREGF